MVDEKRVCHYFVFGISKYPNQCCQNAYFRSYFIYLFIFCKLPFKWITLPFKSLRPVILFYLNKSLILTEAAFYLTKNIVKLQYVKIEMTELKLKMTAFYILLYFYK